jgi:hypothetical protein
MFATVLGGAGPVNCETLSGRSVSDLRHACPIELVVKGQGAVAQRGAVFSINRRFGGEERPNQLADTMTSESLGHRIPKLPL